MSENLIIVESPAKAKTIEGFLGKGYVVKSSYGHVRDLAKSDKAIDVKNDFSPLYEISEDKKAVISELTRLSKKADVVWLATDEDREGEAISWHLFETLGLSDKKTKRIVFHEITKPAILNAIANPRKIDKNLVDAQQARRMLDRLVGFELSPILWKKVRPSLSAGRVQSVAVRLIVEREREIEAHKSSSAFKIVALFHVTDDKGKTAQLKAEHPTRFKTSEEAEKYLKSCIGETFTISNLEKKPGKKTPSAPFTTSTLQQEAGRKLGFSVSQTMVVAQKLYESGKITYMRTDSVNLSTTAIDAAKNEITSSFGKEYSNPRQYKTKNASAQEAHEAIRPTYFSVHAVDGDNNERRLYDLIWKRAIASQMSDARIEKTIVNIGCSGNKDELVATGEVVQFDGFLKVYMESSDEESDENESGLLPPLKKGQVIDLQDLTASEKFTYPPARYTEASLVKKMEELGIGRPSTYAPTISTIVKRQYVLKEDRPGRDRLVRLLSIKGDKVVHSSRTEVTGAEKSKIFPTDIGTVVTDFLVKNFKDIMDYNFTAEVEKEFDDIAEGNIRWVDMLKEFYNPFHKTVEYAEKNTERASGERILGTDPQSGKTVSARIGKFGPIVQIKGDKDDESPRYSKLRSGQRLETISLEEALELFKMPRHLGEFEGKDMVVAIGKFGPYVRHESLFVSIPKTDDPYTIGSERAVELILAKRKSDAEKIIKTFKEDPDLKVLKGRWGPYVAWGKKNIKIPKGVEPSSLTFKDCEELDLKQNGPAKAGKSAATSVTAKKKSAAAAKKTAAKTASKAPAKKVAASKPTASKTKVKTAPKAKAATKKKAPAKKKTRK
ncbi:MAG: type I DNA topoisomerase [Bacteroidota bacterium]